MPRWTAPPPACEGSLGSHSSISSMTENEGAFGAGSDDPASRWRLGVRLASLGEPRASPTTRAATAGAWAANRARAERGSIMGCASTIGAGGGRGRARVRRATPAFPARRSGSWREHRAPTLEERPGG